MSGSAVSVYHLGETVDLPFSIPILVLQQRHGGEDEEKAQEKEGGDASQRRGGRIVEGLVLPSIEVDGWRGRRAPAFPDRPNLFLIIFRGNLLLGSLVAPLQRLLDGILVRRGVCLQKLPAKHERQTRFAYKRIMTCIARHRDVMIAKCGYVVTSSIRRKTIINRHNS